MHVSGLGYGLVRLEGGAIALHHRNSGGVVLGPLDVEQRTVLVKVLGKQPGAWTIRGEGVCISS